MALDPWSSTTMPGLTVIIKGFKKMRNILAGVEEKLFTSAEFAEYLNSLVDEFISNPSRIRQFICFYHEKCLEDYINKVTLPQLTLMQGEPQLRELLKGWKDYNELACWLDTMFNIVTQPNLSGLVTGYGTQPNLSGVYLTCFRDQAYKKVETNVRAAVIKLIYQDREACREGKKIDRALLHDVLRLQTQLGTSIDA